MTELFRRLRHLFCRQRLDRELDDEIAFHLEMRAHESGAPAARRRFGSAALASEDARAAWSWRWLDALSRDLRYAFRGLRRSPGFSAVAVLTLALGLGANTAIFAVLYNVVLRPLPYPDAGRLVAVSLTSNNDRRGVRDISFSYPKFQELQSANHVFDAMAAYALRSYTITAPGPAERVRGEIATAAYFNLTGFVPALGRAFLPEEDAGQGAHPIVILGDALWRARFAADPAVIGRTIRLDGATLTVVGVAPPDVRGDSGRAELWLPFSMAGADDLTSRRQHWHQALARLAPGVAVGQAAAEVRAIVRRWEDAQPSGGGVYDATVQSLAASKIDRPLQTGLLVLYGAVGFVLLIACANLANLTVARMEGRRREIAVRVAIGAGRIALVRQVLVENLLLAVFGGAAGIALAAAGLRLLALLRPDVETGFWPTYLRRIDADGLRIAAPVLLFSFALSLVVGFLFGLAPALRAARGALQISTRRRNVAFRSVLLAGQLAVVVVLLVGAGLMIRSFARLAGVPLGVETRHVLTVPISLPYEKYGGTAGRRFFDRLLAEARALPGVDAGTISESLPALERRTVTVVTALDSRPVNEHIGWTSVDPGYLELFRIPIRSGRAFADRDRQGPCVAILNESAARVLFPGQNPIGHRIQANRNDCEVVGVAADVHYEKQKQQLPIVGDMYMSPARPYGNYLVVRASADPMLLLPAIRKIVARIDPEIPVQNASSMDDRVAMVHSYERAAALLMGVFAALALSLAVVGVYGVFSYAVGARRREFGVRVAVGAEPSDIRRLVMRESVQVGAAGLAVGVPAAYGLTRALGGMISGVSAMDPWIYMAAALVLIGVALAASYLPARRASRVDPVETLRCE